MIVFFLFTHRTCVCMISFTSIVITHHIQMHADGVHVKAYREHEIFFIRITIFLVLKLMKTPASMHKRYSLAYKISDSRFLSSAT